MRQILLRTQYKTWTQVNTGINVTLYRVAFKILHPPVARPMRLIETRVRRQLIHETK